jgi:hypothetical protein
MQGSVEARVLVAGLSTTCSQKIHNQLVTFVAYISCYYFQTLCWAILHISVFKTDRIGRLNQELISQLVRSTTINY